MSRPEILRWETLTKKRFDQIDRERAVVLVTCSPLEVHGPHLPLGADLLEGEGLAERMVEHLPEQHADRTFLKLPFVYVASDPVPQPEDTLPAYYLNPGNNHPNMPTDSCNPRPLVAF